MPRVPISENCLKCLSSRDFSNEMCPWDCKESRIISETFDLCWGRFDDNPDDEGNPCRHIEDCTSDPRTCGYWLGRGYPVEVS